MAKAYRVNRGLSYRTKAGEQRVEAGTVVSDLPFKSIPWLVEQGHVEPVEDEDGDA